MEDAGGFAVCVPIMMVALFAVGVWRVFCFLSEDWKQILKANGLCPVFVVLSTGPVKVFAGFWLFSYGQPSVLTDAPLPPKLWREFENSFITYC